MDLNAIDPRASSPAGSGRNAQSSNGGAFQGVMQMMAEIADRRTETKARDGAGNDNDRRADRAEEPTTREARTDDRRETGETEKTETAATGERPEENAVAVVPETGAPDRAQAPIEEPATPLTGTEAAATAAPDQAAGQTMNRPASAPADILARAAAAPPQRSDQPEPAAKVAAPQQPTGAKPEAGTTRSDLPMGAKVSVEPPTPVARSQGVSSAVLVQAQQAAAAGQPQLQASTANGGAGTLHVGGNQPTFVGADGNAASGQNSSGQNGATQNGSGQAGGNNAGTQNQGQNAGTPQQIGAGFGATIGQRGFGGEASRAQFQQILATRTARPQPAALASGESGRPMGSAGAPLSNTPLTMAGVGGPQSTHTSASPVDRAAATAHGRPGATLGTPADQVAVKLSATAQDGGGKVTVRLNPEELGKVDIKMEISKDGHVRAVVSVDRPETLELLQKDAKGLERALQDAGLQTDGESLEFDLRGDGDGLAGETGDDDAQGTGEPSDIDEGDVVADDQQSDPGTGGMKADGSLDMVA